MKRVKNTRCSYNSYQLSTPFIDLITAIEEAASVSCQIRVSTKGSHHHHHVCVLLSEKKDIYFITLYAQNK